MTEETVSKCPSCGGLRVARGTLACPDEGGRPVFRPAKMRRWVWPPWSTLIPVAIESEICCDCGFFWSAVDPAKAARSIRRCGTPEMVERLGLVDKKVQAGLNDLD